ncbi:hypothetical protein [Spongiactinospora rosea]|uniref:hypothetical protein n=1 Tax=Spongiactinospora rosea TaxID=2248750 RepID=UPI0011C04644|nr:hypothetical protein [Spongiactinospora rosea]
MNLVATSVNDATLCTALGGALAAQLLDAFGVSTVSMTLVIRGGLPINGLGSYRGPGHASTRLLE